MPTMRQLRTRPLPLSPPYEPTCIGGFGVGVRQTPQSRINASGNKSGYLFLTVSTWGWKYTAPPLSPLFFPRALTFYSQAIRSYLECVTRAILHHLTAQVPPLAGTHWGRRGSGASGERNCSQPRRRLNSSYLLLLPLNP